MGHYRSEESVAAAPALPTSRDDIVRYQQDLSYYVSKFGEERQETEYLLQAARDAQNSFQAQITEQKEKIAQLTMLVLTLTNKLEKLNGSGEVK